MVGWFLGATYSVSPLQEAPESEARGSVAAAGTAPSERILALEQSLIGKDRELVALRDELEEVRSRAANRNPVEADEEVAVEEEPMNPFLANAQAMAVESGKARRQEELDKLKLSLNLSPDQLSQLEAFYEQDAEREAKMMEQVFSGKPMEVIQEEAMETLGGVKYHTVSQLLKDILTPEQLEAHEANEAQEALERKESTAYRELSTLQNQLLLNEEQKDAVFAIFYEKEYAVSPDDWSALEIDPQDPEFFLKSRAIENERLFEELSDALTPDQLETFRKKKANETEMLRKSMQMFKPPVAK